MTVIDAAFYPLIVTDRPTDSLYRQPPTGTDMGGVRLCPIADVRPGDWVLGEFERPLNPNRLDTLMQSVACFPALPAALNGYIALDGQSDVWHDEETVLIIPREYIPGATYADRSGGYRPGDRVERTFIYDPIHDDDRDKVGKARPVIQRGTVTSVEDDAFTVAWSGRWVNGRSEEVAMRLVDPVAVARERAVFGFAVGDTVTTEGSYATGVVLELWFHHWAGVPMARVYWPGSMWSNYCSYDFAPTSRYSHKVPENTYDVTCPATYPAPTG
ncbi:hypothetical protein ACPCTN_33475 [Streptomyces cinereoruber]|uniref:hypothetical protein n=1 Tax=Streptomyces cinereoruber TaxID=67260 RepID=UPI003C2C7DE1